MRMTYEHTLTLRQADEARVDLYVVDTELEAIHARLAGCRRAAN
jgi:hypothetical protein